MPAYARGEERDWARERLQGVINVIIPSFTSDLAGINERAIRHDVRKQLEHGFDGALLVSEVSITQDEYRDFCAIAADEARGRQIFFHHSSWSDLEQAKAALRTAQDTGADVVLLSYPPNFYPQTEQDVYEYTRAICDATSLAVMLFPMFLWGFSPRIHASDIPAGLLRRLIDDCPNIVAIKAEGGPGDHGGDRVSPPVRRRGRDQLPGGVGLHPAGAGHATEAHRHQRPRVLRADDPRDLQAHPGGQL
jgi:4-hydroxy-tetrahydrodipicolinate synthase